MPFTIAHPAIVLPLLQSKWKKLISASGLIVGSMTPDFESFVMFNERKNYSHSWTGMFWYDMPMGLLLLFVFHNWVRGCVIPFLPGYLRQRCGHLQGFNWNAYFMKRYPVILLSLLLGIFSHLLWDAFTHWNLAHPHGLDSTEYITHNGNNDLLQYGSTLIGIYFCGRALHHLPVSYTAPYPILPISRLTFWLLCIGTGVAVFILRLIILPYEPSFITLINFCISGIVYGLAVASGLFSARAYLLRHK